jgi:hypothetical protein
MFRFLHYEKMLCACLILTMSFSQAALAQQESDGHHEKTAVEAKDKKADEHKDSETNTLKIITDVVLSPAHYAILLGGKILPHHDDKTGEAAASPVTDGSNITRKWNHKLPFMAQKVVDMGYHLPNPYGFSGIYSSTKQNLTLSDLRISFGADPDVPQTAIPFVTFQQSKADARAWEAKSDAWLFPFMDAYLIGGRVDGSALVPIIVPGEAALKALLPTLGALCDKPAGFPGRPEACDKDFVILDNANYTGTNYGFGINLAGGWKNFFVAIPVSYVWSHLSNTSTRVTALNASARVGFSVQPKHTGMLSFYTGVTYLDTEQDIEGIFKIDTGIPDIGEVDINYTIHQQGAEPWNYLVGFNWTLTPNWWVQAEVGFGGQRSDFVTSLTYRW